MKARGRFRTDAEGRYWFWSIRPYYPVPDDGPVGDMLRATNRSIYRPGHIHMQVSAPGHVMLTTHVFVAGSPYIDEDAVFGKRDGWSSVEPVRSSAQLGSEKTRQIPYQQRLDAELGHLHRSHVENPARRDQRRSCRSPNMGTSFVPVDMRSPSSVAIAAPTRRDGTLINRKQKRRRPSPISSGVGVSKDDRRSDR